MVGRIDRDNFWAGDEGDTQEITFRILIINDSSESEDYMVQIHSQSGNKLAKYPTIPFASETVGPGHTISVCISSDCSSSCRAACADWNRGDIGDVFEVRLIRDVFGWNNPVDDRIFGNTARPNLIFNTYEEALASVTDEDRRNNQITGECGIICQFIRENKMVIIVGGVIIGGLLAYLILQSLKKK